MALEQYAVLSSSLRIALTVIDQTHKGWKRFVEGDGTYMLSKPSVCLPNIVAANPEPYRRYDRARSYSTGRYHR
jgi:hypothetical protein